MIPLGSGVVRRLGEPVLFECSQSWRHETQHEATCHNRHIVAGFHRIVRLLPARSCVPRPLKSGSGTFPSPETGKSRSLDAVKLQSCVKAQNEDAVRASMKEADGLGINGTPALFIN